MKISVGAALVIISLIAGCGWLFVHEQERSDAEVRAEARAKDAEREQRILEYQQAILIILNQNRVDFEFAKRKRTIRAILDYARYVNGYDTSKCPRDFQMAWVDFGTALTELANAAAAQQREQFGRAIKAGVDLASLFVPGGAVLTTANAFRVARDGANAVAEDVTRTGNPYADKVLEASAACKKVAIRHEIVFH